MKKLLVISLFLVLLLSGCKGNESIYNFKIRKDDVYFSEDGNVIIEYKTNGDGKLIELNIDRLLNIDDMIYLNPLIDYEYVLEGFTGDIFMDAGYLCTDYDDLLVPVNIEVGSTRFIYDRNDCEYQEVDRNNIVKSGSYARSFNLEGTIAVSKDTIISVVVYDVNSIEKFVDIFDLPHTYKMLGVYSIGINNDRDGFSGRTTNYFYDIGIYEQLILKHQENELAIGEVNGMTLEINLLDFNEIAETIPLVDEFDDDFEMEQLAVDELFNLIGVISTVDTEPDEEDSEAT